MNSNLTAAEQWRIHGRLSPESVEKLLDLREASIDLKPAWACSALDEAIDCLPAEDALTAPMRDLAKIIKRSRGNGRELLQEVFNDLHAAMEKMRLDAAHAREQIEEVQKAISAYPVVSN